MKIRIPKSESRKKITASRSSALQGRIPPPDVGGHEERGERREPEASFSDFGFRISDSPSS
jgi:hypothetical protein